MQAVIWSFVMAFRLELVSLPLRKGTSRNSGTWHGHPKFIRIHMFQSLLSRLLEGQNFSLLSACLVHTLSFLTGLLLLLVEMDLRDHCYISFKYFVCCVCLTIQTPCQLCYCIVMMHLGFCFPNLSRE